MDAPSAITERIRKLLRLARDAGATEAESTLAAEKAQALLDEYKLCAASIAVESDAPHESTTQHSHQDKPRTPMWRRVLRTAVADTSYCCGVRSASSGVWHVFGKPSDVATVLELYAFLAEQIERLARSERLHGKSEHHDFKLACASRVGRRLREAFRERQAQAAASHGESTALALYNDAQAAQALSKKVFARQTKGSSARMRDSDAFSRGWAAGDKVRIGVERKLAARDVPRIREGS